MRDRLAAYADRETETFGPLVAHAIEAEKAAGGHKPLG
jgi:hypothetical protein